MNKSNFYNECLADLKRAFNGSTKVSFTEEDSIGRLTVTFENVVGYQYCQYLDFLITFGDEYLIIEGCSNGYVCSTTSVDYDEVDFIGAFKEKFIRLYGEVNAEIMREMYN